MRPHEPNNVSDDQLPPRRRDYSLFFFQQQGQRSHLRFTPLGAIAFVLIILIPIITILILFFINARTPFPEVNINVRTAPATPYSPNMPLIKLPAAQPPPQPLKPSKMPPRPTPPELNNNATELIKIPTPTPQPKPKPSPLASPP